METEKDILYQNNGYWVCRSKHGFEVYRNKLTHSERCAQIGFKGTVGLNKAIAEADKQQDFDTGYSIKT